MENTQRPPQIQRPAPLPMFPAANQPQLPAFCVLGRKIPVRWLKASSTTVQVRRLD
jgi:hypothetical protein